jgi:hypothetical protein
MLAEVPGARFLMGETASGYIWSVLSSDLVIGWERGLLPTGILPNISDVSFRGSGHMSGGGGRRACVVRGCV